MGKVLDTFTNGYAGAISRSVDDVVIPLSNTDTAALDYGVPVVYDAAKTGGVKFTSDSVAADFIGITVRSASKTPSTYGSNVSSYAPGEMMDVLVRGSTVVPVSGGTPAPGGAVYVVKASGAFSAAAGEDNSTVLLTNARFRSVKDKNNQAEIVLLDRNLQ